MSYGLLIVNKKLQEIIFWERDLSHFKEKRYVTMECYHHAKQVKYILL